MTVFSAPAADYSSYDVQHNAVALVQIIRSNPSVICSGTQLARNIYLTAAHCLPENPVESSITSQFNKDTGLSVLTQNKFRDEFKPVRRWIIHPQFRQQPEREREDFDLALIRSEDGTPTEDEHLSMNFENASARPFKNDLLWISGFSPKRTGLSDPLEIIRSPEKWSNVQVKTYISSEGKYLAVSKSRRTTAACAGDSGAPAWNFEYGKPTLSGVVVQADCELGRVKIVDIGKYSDWIKRTLTKLNAETKVQ